MTDYQSKLKRTPIKRLVLKILEIRFINKLVYIFVQNLIPNWDKKYRIPISRRYAKLELADKQSVTLINPSRCSVAMEVCWGGGVLQRKSDMNSLMLAVYLAKYSDTFIDVGSYTGVFCLATAKFNPLIKAYAFEIVPDNYKLLVENIRINKFENTIFPALMGIGSCVSQIAVPNKLSVGVLPSSVALDSNLTKGQLIQVTTLDDLFNQGELLNPFLKIDVEGFEYEVMRGGHQFFAQYRPNIICEFLTKSSIKIRHVEEYLNSLEYFYYHICDSSFVRKESIKPSSLYRDWFLTVTDYGPEFDLDDLSRKLADLG